MKHAPVQWDQQRFEQELGHHRELISMVLQQFLLDVDRLGRDLLAQLESAQEPARCRDLAHALKGAAAQVRCHALAEVCAIIEQECQTPSAITSASPTTFAQIIDAVSIEIRTYLSDNAR